MQRTEIDPVKICGPPEARLGLLFLPQGTVRNGLGVYITSTWHDQASFFEESISGVDEGLEHAFMYK